MAPKVLKVFLDARIKDAEQKQEVVAVNRLAEDVKATWMLLSPDDKDSLTWTQMLEALKLFKPDMTLQDTKLLCGAGTMTHDKLRNLLCRTPLPKDADAEVEAMKFLGVRPDTCLELSTLRALLEQMPGMGQLDAEDMTLLRELTDQDRDGRINLQDFRSIGGHAPPSQPQTARLLKQLTIEQRQKAQGSLRRGTAAPTGS